MNSFDSGVLTGFQYCIDVVVDIVPSDQRETVRKQLDDEYHQLTLSISENPS